MNKELLNFVKTLTENDTKTLSQKGLKTTEEVGELAKAILPFENAAGTLHRFVQKNQILENAIDTILCALSIAYDLKFSDEEIEEMMIRKSKKWSELQANEKKAKYPLPFEIHVSVEIKEEKIDRFKLACDELKVKPIVLDLEKDNKNVMRDVMTSSIHYGDNNSSQLASNFLAIKLVEAGYKVTRVKIETVPWHPAAPSVYNEGRIMPKNSYFESHLRIVTTNSRKSQLQDIADEFGAHLSRNVFKKLNDDEYIIMMTLRDSDEAYEPFKMVCDKLKETLEVEDFVVDKMEIEFAVYDTNTSHDKAWIGK